MSRRKLQSNSFALIFSLLIVLSSLTVVNLSMETVDAESEEGEEPTRGGGTRGVETTRGDGDTLYVDDDAPDGGDGSLEKPYQKIQDAIDISGEGDTIRVFNGTYIENITIQKSIEIVGNGSKETVIRGIGTRDSHITQIGHFIEGSYTPNYFDITIKDGLGYIPNGYRGFDIVNISDLANPVLVGSNHSYREVRHIAVEEEFAYLASGREGFVIFNVSDPTSPRFVGEVDTNETAWGVAVRGDYAFVADLNDGLIVVDISNRSDPRIIAEVENNSRSMKIELVNDLAYIADDSGAVEIINISNPKEPRIVGYYNSIGSSSGLTIQGEFLYLADDRSGMEILDISNRTNPTFVGRFKTDGSIRDVEVDGNFAFLADYDNGLTLLDISNKSAPCRLATNGTNGISRGVAFLNGTVFIADWENGLVIFNVSLDDPVIVHITAPDVIIRDVSVIKGSGILIDGDAININNCTIAENSYGIRVVNGSEQAMIQDNFIHSNSAFGIIASNNMNILVNATLNYWGSARGPPRMYSYPYGEGNFVSDGVISDPWLISPHSIRSTIYVAINGNDNTGIGSPTKPFRTIQKAVDEASIWDTIRIFAGTYFENVIIEIEGIQIIGNGSAETIINGSGEDDVILVKGDYVNITGLHATNAGSGDYDSGIELYRVIMCNISRNLCTGSNNGIYLRQSDNVTVFNNSVEMNSFYGIHIDSYSDHNVILKNTCNDQARGIDVDSHHNIISQNNFSHNDDGILISGGSTNNNIVERNIIFSNKNNGIYINNGNQIHINHNDIQKNGQGIYVRYSENSSIIGNILAENDKGIYLRDSNNNDLKTNSIISNGIGLILEDLSHNNSVHWNDFVNNTEFGVQAVEVSIKAENNWWGAESGPHHPVNNSEGAGDNVTDNVNFDPWLRQTSTLPPRTIYVSTEGNDLIGNGSAVNPYMTIQKAVDESEDWDTIRVFEGVYEENVVVNKSVEVIGNGSGETVIKWPGPKVTEVGSLDTTGSAIGISVRGDFVYISDRENGLVIVNISDPWKPTLAGHLESQEASFDIEVFGNYAYVADSGNGLIIINISNPTNPEQEGWYETNGSSKGLAVQGDYVFIADGNNDIVIVDITNKSNPIFVGHCDTPGRARNIVVDGDYAYVAASEGGLIIVNVTDKQNPVFAGQFDTSSSSEDVTVKEKLAFVADNNNGLVIIDITDPSIPVLVGHHVTEGAFGVTILDDYAFIADGNDGFEVVDIMNPAHPTHIVSYGLDDWAIDLVVQGNRAYIANHDSGLSILEYNVPNGIVLQLAADNIDISGLTVCNSSDAGIIVDGEGIEIDSCQITGNNDGIKIINDSKNIEINSCDIYENERYGINVSDDNNRTIFPLFNWWGHPSGPYHPTLNPDGKGNAVSDYVVFDPWLTRPKDYKEYHVSPDGNDTSGTGSQSNTYGTIQKAINTAQDWDTIMVAPGTYTESITINKRNVTILGNSAETTILDAEGAENTCTITSDNIELYGFTIKNGNGILITNSNGNRIVNCIFPDNSYDVNLTNSRDNQLINTTFESVNFNDAISDISVLWPIDLKVTDNRSGFIPNAHLEIADTFGTTIFDGYTEDVGRIPQMLLQEYYQNITTQIYYKPYTISVMKNGYLDFSEEFIIESYSPMTFKLQNHNLPLALISGEIIQEVDMDSEIFFDGSESTGRSITHRWLFGDGGFSSSSTPSHTYTSPGAYQVNLTVTDDYNNASSTSIVVIVENVIPIVRADSDRKSVFEDEAIQFVAYNSWDTASDVLNFYWDFDDGTNSSDDFPTHVYHEAGVYTVSLTAMDMFGGKSTKTINVTVSNNEPWIMETNVTGMLYPGKPLQFSVTAYDTLSDVPNLKYTWDFGDGTISQEKYVTHMFHEAGMFYATVTVIDDNGDSDSESMLVVIADPVITTSVSSTSIFQDETVFFNASHELDDSSFVYTWYFGDGSAAVGNNVSHTYTVRGNFTPILTVNDGIQNNTMLLQTISVHNVIPTAVIHGNVISVMEDEEVTFRANRSYDSPSDMSRLTYTWRVGFDSFYQGDTLTISFSNQYSETVLLIVSDGEATDLNQTGFIVLNGAPVATASSPQEGVIEFGSSIILDASASTDTPSDINGLNYTWKIGNDEAFGKVASYRVKKAGQVTVTLIVRDYDNFTSEDTLTFDVSKKDDTSEDAMNLLSMSLIIIIIALIVVIGFLIAKLRDEKLYKEMKAEQADEKKLVVEEEAIVVEGTMDNEDFKQKDVVQEATVEVAEELDGPPTNAEIEMDREDADDEIFKPPN